MRVLARIGKCGCVVGAISMIGIIMITIFAPFGPDAATDVIGSFSSVPVLGAALQYEVENPRSKGVQTGLRFDLRV